MCVPQKVSSAVSIPQQLALNIDQFFNNGNSYANFVMIGLLLYFRFLFINVNFLKTQSKTHQK